MIEKDGLTGMVSNPTIFEKAINKYDDYDEAISKLLRSGISTMEIYETLTFEDMQQAADLFRPVYDESNGRDGFVSLEVSPHLAYDAEQTIPEAKRLWVALDRPNVMIKMLATRQALFAIEQLITAGVNVNITFLFGLKRYREVVDAFMTGLKARAIASQPLEHVASVASFFLNRIDVLVDKRLNEFTKTTTGESVKLYVADRRGLRTSCVSALLERGRKYLLQALPKQGGRQTQRLL